MFSINWYGSEHYSKRSRWSIWGAQVLSMWVFISLLYSQLEAEDWNHWAIQLFVNSLLGVIGSWFPQYYFGIVLRIAEKIHINYYKELEALVNKEDKESISHRFQIKNAIIYFIFYGSIFWFYLASFTVMTFLMQDIGRRTGWIYVGSCLLGIVMDVLVFDFLIVLIGKVIKPSVSLFRLRGYYFEHEEQLKMVQYDELHPY